MVYDLEQEKLKGSIIKTKKSVDIELPSLALLLCAIISIGMVIFIIGFIFYTAIPTFQKQGINFIIGTQWNYDTEEYGMLDLIAGTLSITIMTIIIACPLSLLTAIFLAEYSPKWMSSILRPMIELLVGIPSVVYGIFGWYVLDNIFANSINPMISSTLGFIPIFRNMNPGQGYGILLASTVLSIMILPTITSLSVEAINAVPQEYKEASLAIGANKWETTKKVVLPMAFSGIMTSILLGLMRAMGETMAVVMLAGNKIQIPGSILAPVYTMTSKILNDIPVQVADEGARSALFGIAAVLIIFEVIVIGTARFIGKRGMGVRKK